MNEQELNKFCDDFAFDFVTGLSIEPEFENVTGKSMRKVYEGLKNSLKLSIINLHEEDETMIERTIKWVKENIHNYIFAGGDGKHHISVKLIDDLRNAMKGGDA